MILMDEFVFLVRFALLGASAFLIGSALLLAVEYWKAGRRSVSVFAIKPIYVVFFMISYSLFVAYGTLNLVVSLEYPDVGFTWRAVPLIAAMVTGVIAIYKIATYRRSDKDPDLK